MTEVILLPLFTSLVCMWIAIATWQWMILNKIRKWCYSKLPEVLYEPLFWCPYCMASVRSIVTHTTLSLGWYIDFNIFLLLVCIPATATINYCIFHYDSNIFPYVDDKTE